MKIKAVFACLSALLILLTALNVRAFDNTNIKAEVEVFLQKQVERTNAPSLSVSVGYKGELLLSVAKGFANHSTNSLASINTQYRTGSVSKVIGTTALMPLIENNRISLNDNISKYLHYLPSHYRPIRLKHILTHTSGIRHYKYGEYGTNINYSTLADATKVFRDDPLTFKPGTDYLYSTYGINLMQGIIESITQKPLASYLSSALFQPLGMNNTELEMKGNNTSQYAVGYRSVLSNIPVKEIDVSNKYIGGGMRTTPTDLIIMVNAINSGKIMNEETKKLMLTVPFSDTASDRALGWRWMEYKGQKAFVHSGAINGFESFLAHFVEEDITVAVMVNEDNYDYTSETLYKVLEIARKELGLKQR